MGGPPPPPFPGVADIYLGHFLPCSGSLFFLPFSSQFFTPPPLFFAPPPSFLLLPETGTRKALVRSPCKAKQASRLSLPPYSRRYLLQDGRGFNGKVVKTAALLQEKLVLNKGKPLILNRKLFLLDACLLVC